VKIAATLLVASLLGIPAGAFAQSQPVLRGYAVLGVHLVRIGPSVRVQPGSVGATTGTVRLATAAQVGGAVVAGTVRVARRVRVGRLSAKWSRVVASARASLAARRWADRRFPGVPS
jgi:hypothetical protein